MGQVVGLLWVAVWSLLVLLALARSIHAYRRDHLTETGGKLPALRVIKARRWQSVALPLAAVMFVAIAVGAAPLRRFIAAPEPLEGVEIVALSAVIIYLLIVLWRIGS